MACHHRPPLSPDIIWGSPSLGVSDISPSLIITGLPSRYHQMYTLPLRRVRDVLEYVVPGLSLTSIDDIPTKRLPRLYTLHLSDSRKLLLSLAPSLSVRLLRQERTLLLSEAKLICLLASMNQRQKSEEGGEASSESLVNGEPNRSFLGSLVPRLLKHSSDSKEMGYPYTIFEPPIGVPLSTLSVYLSIPERRDIDRQIGLLTRHLALVTSPSGAFGPAARVCEDEPSQVAIRGSSSPSRSKGSDSWTAAFLSLLEGILRDGEDMSVVLPYEVIRQQFTLFSPRLDAVTTPRLFVLDIGDERNVMVERGPETATPAVNEAVKLTGLRDWTQGIFGDPLMASCFEEPSAAFLSGWMSESEEDLIEDRDGASTRQLLYKCYRAIVCIVTCYYRHQIDSGRRELEARKVLTNTLAELEKTDLASAEMMKRPRSDSVPQIQGSPKRQKIGPEDVQA